MERAVSVGLPEPAPDNCFRLLVVASVDSFDTATITECA
jgi:hypothetical protein